MIKKTVTRVTTLLALGMFAACQLAAFDVDLSEQPATHPPLAPADGEEVDLNPPPMIWRVNDRAASYILEFARDERFRSEAFRVEGIDLPFYNHSAELAEGTWFWRYYVVDRSGKRSRPSPARSFVVTERSTPFPVPSTEELLASMPDHPRIFTTPADLEEFRARRHGPAREAWLELERRADQHVQELPEVPRLVPMGEASITGPTPDSNSWREGQPVRRQIFFLRNGDAFHAPDYGYRTLTSDAAKVGTLSYAYLVSGERKYADAAREWANFVSQARVDFHLSDPERASHDTAVYCYEQGLKNMAIAYDRIQHYLTEDEKTAMIEHIEYHGHAAYEWLRNRVQIHLAYQQSHPQQAMHPLLTTALAVATESEAAAEWMDYLVRQYANRIAWTSDDGGYFEGQTYGHKFQWILEALVSMRTATGIDAFKKPRIRNSGDFWLYSMSLNYWYEHGGDIYSLIWPFGNSADAYITNLMASMNGNRYVQWWADTVFANPVHIPFQYISQTDLKPKPPMDIAQARLFPQTGQLAAYDRFYDHKGNRVFFRSSQWGAHSHSHADQNGFVIHANGEILAADVGYYTYYGDDYHMKWTVTSNTHNTLLVNGEGQPKSIDSKGDITAFFHSPVYTYFVGDASAAYEKPLTRYKRSMVFIRPDVWVVHDEVAADEPSTFSWLLNTFDQPEIDSSERTLIVAQRETRLRVDHLLPEQLSYESSNERRFPMLTRAWTRFTEAFPEPWHNRVTTEAVKEETILAVMHSYEEGEGSRIENRRSIDHEDTVGLVYDSRAGREIVLFRRDSDASTDLEGEDVVSDGRVASLLVYRGNEPGRWMISGGSRLTWAGKELFWSPVALDVAADWQTPAAAAQIWVQGRAEGELEVALPRQPGQVFIAPPHAPREAEAVSVEWRDGRMVLPAPAMDEWVVWVDPVVDLRQPLPQLQVTVRDSAGEQQVDLELAVADNGEWIGYVDLMPRETGLYTLTSSVDGAELLLQDRWDPVVSARGVTTVSGMVRDGTELFVRFAPGQLPALSLDLRESHRDRIVSFLRNGNFEEGTPNYPPRGWTLSRVSRDPDQGWPGWSQEEAFEGESSMKFVRPTGLHTANSQPMRLRTGGRYVLRFMAKGDATHAIVVINSNRGQAASLPLEPSDNWREYRVEVDLDPGYTQVHIRFNRGGEPDQVLWVDDMEFGLVPEETAPGMQAGGR
jgi:hypothetical protein